MMWNRTSAKISCPRQWRTSPASTVALLPVNALRLYALNPCPTVEVQPVTAEPQEYNVSNSS
ncbi:hypothetical protein OSTOST_22509, partial [Ostertagia ostertagi]